MQLGVVQYRVWPISTEVLVCIFSVSLCLITLIPRMTYAAESNTLQKCEGLLSAYVRLKIDVEQAALALNIQKAMTEVCQKLIEAEKPKPVDTKVEEQKTE